MVLEASGERLGVGLVGGLGGPIKVVGPPGRCSPPPTTSDSPLHPWSRLWKDAPIGVKVLELSLPGGKRANF